MKRLEFTTSVKVAINLSGFLVDDVRLPLVYPGEADLGKLRDVMTKAGIEVA
ncbi:hypothetical protein [Anaerosporomusa subterranea]|uniref:hypothetical protein n=1 Tax=Anaerosporomusa subterranea TaxID=1794912 RepID=UPI0012E8DA7B|nr:hypothetical protein [Anaerosporomusa subterranea]